MSPKAATPRPPARRYRLTPARRLANWLTKGLVRAGLAPRHTYLLEVRGRRTGRRYTTPVRLVENHGYALARRALRRAQLGQERARERRRRAPPRLPPRAARSHRARAGGERPDPEALPERGAHHPALLHRRARRRPSGVSSRGGAAPGLRAHEQRRKRKELAMSTGTAPRSSEAAGRASARRRMCESAFRVAGGASSDHKAQGGQDACERAEYEGLPTAMRQT
jgi:hypothetical protein